MMEGIFLPEMTIDFKKLKSIGQKKKTKSPNDKIPIKSMFSSGKIFVT